VGLVEEEVEEDDEEELGKVDASCEKEVFTPAGGEGRLLLMLPDEEERGRVWDVEVVCTGVGE
jgi:hypothetical protein